MMFLVLMQQVVTRQLLSPRFMCTVFAKCLQCFLESQESGVGLEFVAETGRHLVKS